MRVRASALMLLASLFVAACSSGTAFVASDTAPTEASASTTAPTATDVPKTTPSLPSALVVQDRLGRTLTFEQLPKRVVTIYNGGYGMLATLGVRPVAQAVNPEMLDDPLYFDGTGATIRRLRYTDSVDAEDLVSIQPDLIIAYTEEEVQAFSSIAPVFAELDFSDLDGLYAALRTYGTLLGREAEAEQAIGDFQERLAAYAAQAPGDVSVLKVGMYDTQTFSVATTGDPVCQLLNEVAQCMWKHPSGEDTSWGYDVSLEGLLSLNPDVIILNNWTGNSAEGNAQSDAEMQAALAAEPLWNELQAVQNGRVLSVSGYSNPIASSIPAATKFLDTYLPLIYPDVFDGPLTDAEVQALAGSAPDTAAANRPVPIVDGSGTELSFDTPPERVVCLDNKCVEELAFLGIKPVGVGAVYNYNIARDPNNFGEAAEDIAQIATDPDIDFEHLATLAPDLVIGWEELRPPLTDIAPLYTLYYEGDSLEEFTTDTRTLARLFGIENVAEEKIQSALARLNAYAERAPGDKTLFITGGYDGTGEPAFFTYDPDAFWPCGILNKIAQCAYPDGPGGDVSLEGLLALDPDVIVLEEYDPENGIVATAVAALAADNPLWRELTAYQNDQIFVIPRTRARLATLQSLTSALDTLMPLIYPDVFNGPLTEAEVQEIAES